MDTINNLQSFKVHAIKLLGEAFACNGMDGVFSISFSELLIEPPQDNEYSATFDVMFSYGNCIHNHTIQVTYRIDDNEFGIDHGEDGTLTAITFGNVMAAIYFDLALSGLDEKFHQ
jgi:hypothetical protein